MPAIVNISTAFPEHTFSQDQIFDRLSQHWQKLSNSDESNRTKSLEKIFKNVGVESRSLSAELEDYFRFDSFNQKNDLFIKVGSSIAIEAVKKSLAAVDLPASAIDGIWSNTVTGFAIPSLDTKVINQLNLKPSVKRMPMMGLGCMAGVSGLNRVCEYLRGNPREAHLFFSVELCSLTFQLDDTSIANVIGTSLFGDGCACVLVVGDEHPLASDAVLKFEDSRPLFFYDSEEVMGWKVGEHGLKLNLQKSVPEIVTNKLPEAIARFLKKNQLETAEIASFFAHPGGPKVLKAVECVCDRPEGSMTYSWESLKQKGNMSSVSVLHIIQEQILAHRIDPSSGHALALALGPGFNAEMGLYSWIS